MRRKLQSSLCTAFTGTQRSNHIANNLSIFIDKLEQSVTDNIVHKETHEKRLKLHFTLLLIEKIIYKAGFVLRELDGNDEEEEEEKEKFVNYVAGLIAFFANPNV